MFTDAVALQRGAVLETGFVIPENYINDRLALELFKRIFDLAADPVVRRVCRAWRIISNEMAKDLRTRLLHIPEIAALIMDPNPSPWQNCREMWEPFKEALSIYHILPNGNVFSLSALQLQQLSHTLQIQRDVSFIFFCRNHIPLFIQEELLDLLDNEEMNIHDKAALLRIALQLSHHVRELTHLEIQGRNLTVLPPEIVYFNRLERLNIKGNKLLALPREVGLLPDLHYLWVSGNKLSSLPRGAGLFLKLQELHIDQNSFRSLPPLLLELPYLQKLRISRNNHEASRDKTLIETLCYIRSCYVELVN